MTPDEVVEANRLLAVIRIANTWQANAAAVERDGAMVVVECGREDKAVNKFHLVLSEAETAGFRAFADEVARKRQEAAMVKLRNLGVETEGLIP